MVRVHEIGRPRERASLWRDDVFSSFQPGDQEHFICKCVLAKVPSHGKPDCIVVAGYRISLCCLSLKRTAGSNKPAYSMPLLSFLAAFLKGFGLHVGKSEPLRGNLIVGLASRIDCKHAARFYPETWNLLICCWKCIWPEQLPVRAGNL
jgi:hypothetical protein